MKKAQAAYEFMMIFFMLSMGFTFWIALASSMQADIQSQRNIEIMEDFTLGLKHELFMIVQMHEGFSKTIELPTKIRGNQYEISSQSYYDPYNFSTIIINSTELGFYTHFDVPLMNDTIKKGTNIITNKQNQLGIEND